MEHAADVPDNGFPVVDEHDILVAVPLDAFIHGLTGHARKRLLTRRVDIHNDDQIGLIEGGEELRQQVLRSRIPVWLEDRDDPAS